VDGGHSEETGSDAEVLNNSLGHVRKKIVEPEEREFASTLVQAHRKGRRRITSKHSGE
jgi:hypothetical protein